MDSIIFWRNWMPGDRRLFMAFAAMAIGAVGFLWLSDWRSPAPVLEAQHFQQLETIDVTVHQFEKGTTTLTVPAEAYVVFEYVFGGPLQPVASTSFLYITLLLAGIITLFAVVTTLRRFWFLAGTGIMIVVLVSLRLDTVGPARELFVVLMILAFGGLGYYFQALRPATPFATRWLLLAGITVAGLIIVSRFSVIPQPFVAVAANGMATGTVLTVVFIFMVAHEIIASFISVVSRANHSQKSLRHFLVISVIYAVNLILLYADKKHLIEWHFLPISLILLITVSGILGLWGFRQREPLYESILPANPFGVYFFLGLATVAFATMGYFVASENDPPKQLIQDCILYSHLGYGLIFLAYIVVNFLTLLDKNLPVYKVLYKPAIMPYFTFRLAGLIATFAFFAYSNWKVSVNQGYAGYYNAMGDYHLLHDSTRLAESFFQRSTYFATRNYHAHYALAQLLELRGQLPAEKKEYTKLADGRPLDLAYLNLAQLYSSDNNFVDAAETLKNGLIDFPNNGRIQNALALLNARMGIRDSALLMANAARSSSRSLPEAETNLAGFSAKFRLGFPADSLNSLLHSEYPGVKSNLLALAVQEQINVNINADPGPDTILTPHAAATLNNGLINPLQSIDTALAAKTVRLARGLSNTYFKNFLLSAAAQRYYRHRQTALAFKLMHEVAFLGQQSKYYDILGLWALEQGATETAVRYFDEAIRLNGKSAFLHRAIALTEADDHRPALEAWDSLRRSGDPALQRQADAMTKILTASPADASSFSEAEKYEFTRHYFKGRNAGGFDVFVTTIENQEVRARAILDQTRNFDAIDETEAAIATFALSKRLQFQDKKLFDRIVHLNLRFLARQQQWALLEKQLASGITFEDDDQLDKSYFDALLAAQAGKKEHAAKLFHDLADADPFFDDAIVAAVAFFNVQGEDKVKTYGILMNALDQNPNSIKLLKSYILQSASVGFEESAQEALDKLKTLLPLPSFLRFVDEHPGIFEVNAN